MLLLGIWPSVFTIAAMLVLPSIFIFGAIIIRPAIVAPSPRLRLYLTFSAILSVLCWMFQFVWLAFQGGEWIPPWH
jgi:hypothetical protein